MRRDVTLDCHIEAFPPSISYWIKGSGETIVPSEKYEIVAREKSYKSHSRLIIKNLQKGDLGTYKCLAKNPLGAQESALKLYGKLSLLKEQLQICSSHCSFIICEGTQLAIIKISH